MKKKRFFFAATGALVLMLLSAFISTLYAPNPINVLIVTGGHAFEHAPFYSLFSAQQNIRYNTLVQPQANAFIASTDVDKYDVLVFYDMVESLLPAEQQAYINLLKKGKAMIFLHHSLVSYQNWEEFIKIVGGQYHTHPVVVKGDTLKANYEHDVVIPVRVEDKRHAVTAGLSDFEIVDEIYGGTEILTTVKPLLSTTHPKSMRYVAWINPYGKSDVLYIQLGHGPRAYANANYRKLIQQAITWSAAHHAARSR